MVGVKNNLPKGNSDARLFASKRRLGRLAKRMLILNLKSFECFLLRLDDGLGTDALKEHARQVHDLPIKHQQVMSSKQLLLLPTQLLSTAFEFKCSEYCS